MSAKRSVRTLRKSVNPGDVIRMITGEVVNVDEIDEEGFSADLVSARNPLIFKGHRDYSHRDLVGATLLRVGAMS